MRSDLGNLMRSLALPFFALANAAVAGTHCAPAETVAFSCELGPSKVVSLCLAKSSGQRAPQLSYRFGRLGQPELVFPSSPANSAQQFRYAHYFRSQVDRTEVSFSNAGVGYAVFDYHEGEQKPSRARGVRVTVHEIDHELSCRGPVVSNLMPLSTLIPCDADSALGSCR